MDDPPKPEANNPPTAPPYNSQSGSKTASWIFGSVLIVFLMFAFFVVHPTPLQCGIVRFFIALTGGLLFLFLVGGIVLQGKLLGFGVGAGGGVAVFFLVQFVVNPVPGCTSIAPEQHSFHHAFAFDQRSFSLSMPNNQTWNHGASSLGQTDDFSGRRVSIGSLKVILDITNNQQLVCCDVWLYIGPAPFGLSKDGGSLGVGYPPYDEPSAAAKAPVLAKFVIGSGGTAFSQGHQTFWAKYDFQKQIVSGYPQVDNVKQSVSQPMNIDKTMYAQVFVWSGNPSINIDVSSISLEIDGTWSDSQ
jgi:hypothetical protein